MSAPTFRERLAFDDVRGEIRDQTRRYMLIRPEALMGVFRHLPDAAKREALDALAHSIFEQGSDSAKAYQALGAADAAALLDVVARTAPQLGWGLWRFTSGDSLLELEVRNSPFAVGHGAASHPVCHAIVGMLRATSTMVFGRPAVAREIRCAAMGAQSCAFEARPEKELA